MKVAVWDTYVVRKDGEKMHFDIIVPDQIHQEAEIYRMGKEYLTTKDQQDQPLTARECRFCHKEIASEEMETSIAEKGYYILEMEGCA